VNVEIGAQTDVGRARELNEDGYVIEEPLFAVADGMGGHRAGEVASRMALETIAEVSPDGGAHSIAERVKAANRVVHQRSAEDRELEGMGTTLTALWMDGAEARIAHVGDSRAYLLRDGELKMLTRDHTLVQRMVDEGKISPEEAEVHPQRSILTRALGVDEDVDVDDLTVEVTDGDRIMLCTDGLTSMIAEDRISEILREHEDPQAAADALVDAANEAGGQDNITVVVIDVSGTGRSGDAGTAPSDEPDASAAAAATQVRPDPDDATPDTPPEPLGEEPAPGAADTAVIRVQDTPMRSETPEPGAWRGGDDAFARPRRRWLVWTAAGLLLLAALGFGAKAWIDRQWYVGVSAGHVAIFRGIPSEVLGLELSSLERTTDLDAADAQRFSSWSELDEGIAVESEEAADAVVEQIRRDLEGGGSSGPGGAEPTPRPTGTA
jgi:protein phosphatase